MTSLTDRELQFIKLLGDGLKVCEISELMFISIQLAWQISNDIKLKTDTYTLHGITMWACKNDIIKINRETLPNEERKAG